MRNSNPKQLLRIANALLLATGLLSHAMAQTGSKNVVLIRNVQIPDGPEKTLHKVDVLVRGSVIVRVDNATKIPNDAISIDGGGNILSVTADGRIHLTQPSSSVAAVPSSNPVVIKVPDEDKVSFKEAVLETPEKTTADVSRAETSPKQSVQQNAGAAAQKAPSDNLAQDVTNPTAPLTTITFQNRYVPSQWGVDDDLNEFSLQIALPYELGGKRQIFRAILPYFTNTPAPGSNQGAGDISLANLTLFPQKGWVFAAGAVVSLGVNKGAGVDTFAVGPAVAALTKKGKFLYGFLNQNLFSFGGDIKITQIQPILSYTLNKKVSFALGDTQTTIDWKQKKFVAVPLSFQVNYIAMLGKQPIRLFFNPQYNVVNSFGQRKWTVGGGFALILR